MVEAYTAQIIDDNGGKNFSHGRLSLLTSTPRYDRLDKSSLVTHQLVYSSIMCAITHPLTVMQTVSENQRKKLTAFQKNEHFFKRIATSYANSLSIKRSFEMIYEKSLDKNKSKLNILRSVYTAFPCLTVALVTNDLLFFIPQIYLTTEIGLNHTVAGTINAATASFICTPFYNIYRHQVKLKTFNQSHTFWETIKYITRPKNEQMNPIINLRKVENHWRLEGIIPRFYRSLGTGILMFPIAGVMWSTYEYSRKNLQNYFQTTHVLTNFFAGVSGGIVNAFIARPIGNIAARKQLSPESEHYSKIILNVLRNEGLASFWAGLSARMVINSIRMGFFFSAFSLLVTFSMQPPLSRT